MASVKVFFLLLVFMNIDMETVGFLQHYLWKDNASLVASVRVASFTVFSPVGCLAECLEKECTLLVLAVTRSSSGGRLDCHLTKITDWLFNASAYLEPCNQSRYISCRILVANPLPHMYFPLDGGNLLQNLGTLLVPDKKPTLLYKLGSQSGNPFTCTGPSGNPHVKYLLNNPDSNNYLIIDLNEKWQPTAGFTLAIWVMFPGSNTAGPMFDFYSNDQLLVYDNHFWFYPFPGQLYFSNIRVGQFAASVMSMTPGQWYHMAMTWSPGGELLFYWNATQIYRVPNAGTTMTGFTPSYLLIGARPAYSTFLQACLAHAIVHNETMSKSQLQHLMQTQMTIF